MPGVHILRVGSDLVVRFVDPATPAAAAGVRRGDVLLALDGRVAATLHLWDVRDALSAGEGRRVTLVVRRDGRDVTVTLTLKRVAP